MASGFGAANPASPSRRRSIAMATERLRRTSAANFAVAAADRKRPRRPSLPSLPRRRLPVRRSRLSNLYPLTSHLQLPTSNLRRRCRRLFSCQALRRRTPMARPLTLTVRGSLCARKRVAIGGVQAVSPGRAGGRKSHFLAISPGGRGSVCARKRITTPLPFFSGLNRGGRRARPRPPAATRGRPREQDGKRKA